MTAALVGAVLIAAELSILVVFLTPCVLRYRRAVRAADAEWVRLVGVIESAHQDFDRSTPVAILAAQVAARADEEARRLGPDVVAEAQRVCREAAQ